MRIFLLIFFIIHFPGFCSAFTDTVALKDGTLIACHIYEYDRDKLKISTSYSNGSFWIKTAQISALKSTSRFTFILSDGRRKLGLIAKYNTESVSIEYESVQETFGRSEIVHFHILKKPFLDRLESSVDFGLILKKENLYRQFLINGKSKYTNERMSAHIKFLISRVFKNNTSPIKRSFIRVGGDYFMKRRIYAESKIKFLESTEQDLNFRFSFSNAIGIRFASNAKIRGRASLGISYNNERFSYDINTFNSYEIYSGIHLTLLEYKDLSISLTSHNYQSISKNNRFRTDSEFFIRYDLPKGFFLTSRLFFSYDSRPHDEIATSDYIFTNGIGWGF